MSTRNPDSTPYSVELRQKTRDVHLFNPSHHSLKGRSSDMTSPFPIRQCLDKTGLFIVVTAKQARPVSAKDYREDRWLTYVQMSLCLVLFLLVFFLASSSSRGRGREPTIPCKVHLHFSSPPCRHLYSFCLQGVPLPLSTVGSRSSG